MIDFHAHTTLSDGALTPKELVERARCYDYKAIAITDHVAAYNIEKIVPKILQTAMELNEKQGVLVLPGAEISFTPPKEIPHLIKRARELGAIVLVVHGETTVESLPKGTNRAAIEAGIDIVGHPGLITLKDAKLATEKGVALEITSRSSHGITNGHVAKTALEAGATLVINSDTHRPSDFISRKDAFDTLLGCGLELSTAKKVLKNNEELLEEFKSRLEKLKAAG